jgi:hypothetical protein
MSTSVALAGCHIFSLIMQVCLAYNVILNYLTVIVVSNIIRSVSDRTEVIPEGLGVNPGCFGWFPNIFINYASLLCLQCNTHENELL